MLPQESMKSKDSVLLLKLPLLWMKLIKREPNGFSIDTIVLDKSKNIFRRKSFLKLLSH
jgi:hypothetical protein